MELPPLQHAVLQQLDQAGGPLHLSDLAQRLKSDQSPVSAACVELQQRGLAVVEERPYDEITLGKDAEAYVAQPLPERVIAGVLAAQGGRCKITEIPRHCPLNAGQVGQSLRWLSERGWAAKAGDELVLSDAGREFVGSGRSTPDEEHLAALAKRAADPSRPPPRREDFPPGALDHLSKRKGFLNIKPRVERQIAITGRGREALRAATTSRPKVTQLTPELMTDGRWREVDFQPYDVTLAAKRLLPGKEHPFQRTLERVRRVFLEMGFTEVASPWIESSFWDFDALFQPQDHPARDMQDTFYIARPDRCRLPDETLVESIRRTHEDGGDTGSTGWRYRWSRELAHKPVLRTHTTAATIRALAEHAKQGNKEVKQGDKETRKQTDGSASSVVSLSAGSVVSKPGKYFVIGPVFRRETVDYKHLPVFHQIDGIVLDPHASLSTLLGTLSAFYGKMGFPKVRFRPSFFPYTEPSAEVFLWLEHRREWVEMGGSGIFRPEVTQPLGIKDRVLAWGLGLERLAMMIHGLKSIGELYFAHMPWLRETPLRQS